MISSYGFLAYALLQIVTICVLFVALCDIARRAFGLDQLLSTCAAVVMLGLLGYLSFWLAYANYAVFGVAKIAVLAGLLIRFGLLVYRRRISDYRWLAEPLLYVTLYCIAVLALGFADGGLSHTVLNANRRFTHLLPADNLTSWSVAVALRFGESPTSLLGDWLLSDRPPLQTGLYLLLGLRSHVVAYQVVASWLQATFLLGAWAIAIGALLPVAARRAVLLACCLLPVGLVNTFFVWPKLLSAACLLLVFALLFCRRPETDSERKASGVLIGALTALALLSHGSSLFALIGFTVAVLTFWAWPALRTMVFGAVTLLVIYGPWALYQALVEPPANRLLKWHFAGVIDIDDRSFLQALRDSYGALSWSDYWHAKLQNLQKLAGSWPRGLLDPLVGPFTGAWSPEAVRSADFFALVPSWHLFAVAVIVALALLARTPHPQRAIAARILVAVLGTLAAFVLLIFMPGETINHHGTYAVQVLATVFAFMVLTLRVPWLALLFIAGQAVGVSATYAFSLPHDPAFWPLLAACGAAMLFLAAYSLAPQFIRTR
jgi:hypothetical protein